MSLFIISYDIANPKRLGRVHRYLKRMACPIQYSGFVFQGTYRQCQDLLLNLLPKISKKEDDLRCYELLTTNYHRRIGKPFLPEGILWPAWNYLGESNCDNMVC